MKAVYYELRPGLNKGLKTFVAKPFNPWNLNLKDNKRKCPHAVFL